MAKVKKKAAANPDSEPADRSAYDALIDQASEDRLSGGADEGAAWVGAFGGAALPTPPDDSPLSDEEREAVRDLMLRAAESGDHAAIDRLKDLANNPAELRQVMAEFRG